MAFRSIVCRWKKKHVINAFAEMPLLWAKLFNMSVTNGSMTMDLVHIFTLVLLTIIAITLVIISIKLTDLLAESKASRMSVQNIESDDLFRQGYQNQQTRQSQAQHLEQILTQLEGLQHLLSCRLRADKNITAVKTSEKTVLYSAEQESQQRFNSHSGL